MNSPNPMLVVTNLSNRGAQPIAGELSGKAVATDEHSSDHDWLHVQY